MRYTDVMMRSHKVHFGDKIISNIRCISRLIKAQLCKTMDCGSPAVFWRSGGHRERQRERDREREREREERRERERERDERGETEERQTDRQTEREREKQQIEGE